MSERRDLISICQALGILEKPLEGGSTPDTLAASDRTDIDLLRSILARLDVPTIEPQQRLSTPDQPSHSDQQANKYNIKSKLKRETLADSLAFPEEVRKRHQDLAQKTEPWNELKKFNDLLKLDYTCRRQMLLNRLDCTIESFKWKAADSARQSGQSLNDLIHEKYNEARIGLREEPQVTISHLLAARQTDGSGILNGVVSSNTLDCKVAYKPTTNQRSNQKPGAGGNHSQDTQAGDLVNLKQIIIPDVPDRGGRPGEIRPPQKETFSQQHKARNSFGGRGRVGGRRR